LPKSKKGGEKVMKKNYELMMIISSKVADAEKTELINKFSKMASPKTTVEKWGIKKFAYPIQYRNEGFYVLMHFEADADKIEEMTKIFNITDGIVRFMFVAKNEKMIASDIARKVARKERESQLVASNSQAENKEEIGQAAAE